MFVCAAVCLFMGLCVSVLFVGPKCVLNPDGDTSIFTLIIFSLHVGHEAVSKSVRMQMSWTVSLYGGFISLKHDQHGIKNLCVADTESSWNHVWKDFNVGHDLKNLTTQPHAYNL